MTRSSCSAPTNFFGIWDHRVWSLLFYLEGRDGLSDARADASLP